MATDLEGRLRELLVFTNPPTAFGLPRSLFFNVCVVSGLVALKGSWWVGIVVFLVLFAPLYRAHQSDPQAARVWRAAISGLVRGVSPAVIRYLPVRFEK